MELEILFKIIDGIITFGLPGTTLFSEEAYAQLLEDVIYDVFLSKIEDAVEDAKSKLRWDAEYNIYRTQSEMKGQKKCLKKPYIQ